MGGRALSLLKIKTPIKNMREKAANTPIIIQFISYVWRQDNGYC
jgi:hypothetical protein